MNLKEQYNKAKENLSENFKKQKQEFVEKQMVEKWKKQELKGIAKEEEWKERVKQTKKKARRKVAHKYSHKPKSVVKIGFGKQSGTFAELPGKNKGKGNNAFSF